MKPLDWSELDLCSVCYAVVPTALRGDHELWHAQLATEAIRSANRLDRIGRI